MMPANQAAGCRTGISMQMLPRPTRGKYLPCAAPTQPACSISQPSLKIDKSLLSALGSIKSLDYFQLFLACQSLVLAPACPPSTWTAFESHSPLFHRDTASYYTCCMHCMVSGSRPAELYHSHRRIDSQLCCPACIRVAITRIDSLLLPTSFLGKKKVPLDFPKLD